jgi:hypothetical protein
MLTAFADSTVGALGKGAWVKWLRTLFRQGKELILAFALDADFAFPSQPADGPLDVIAIQAGGFSQLGGTCLS